MIDQFTDMALRQHASRQHDHEASSVVCLGDQGVCPSLGYPNVKAYFRELGYPNHSDIDYNGKADIQHDLNLPMRNRYPSYSWYSGSSGEIKADLVYGGGTLEHVCNVGQALATMAKMVKVGGLIVQESPIVPYGQAYWGVSPLVQRDFFQANGFREVICIVHYRRNWKMGLLHAIVRRLPKAAADRLAARVRRIPGAKETIFSHDWRDEYVYPEEAWRDRHAFYPHPQTRSLYIGRKAEDVPLNWPSCRRGF
jgi:hypothetical protein